LSLRRRSALLSFVWTNWINIIPFSTSSYTQKDNEHQLVSYDSSLIFILRQNKRLQCYPTFLTVIGYFTCIPIDTNNWLINVTNVVASDNAIYSGSVLDNDIDDCYFLFQTIGPSIFYIMYPLIPRRVSQSLATSCKLVYMNNDTVSTFHNTDCCNFHPNSPVSNTNFTTRHISLNASFGCSIH
jgi:hypothetical protein